nr:immunoglobulin heavy chain junction region [Macaca mulatta]MOX59291.1 immunoglobulin heavy chain junction region [Macaca mulatta]MOX59352.1 immunoglobulin heavy chain junction region [Macaca mulatta]MOX59598.1 immunoglobulin heavy chain junction region [Macaca mulatta]MOX59736.1 immunoglobulin heavy chain junction region [Macaca mulatta]
CARDDSGVIIDYW